MTTSADLRRNGYPPAGRSMPASADLLNVLRDLHKQATVERSHYYTGKAVLDAIQEIEQLRFALDRIAKHPDARDSVKSIAFSELNR